MRWLVLGFAVVLTLSGCDETEPSATTKPTGQAASASSRASAPAAPESSAPAAAAPRLPAAKRPRIVLMTAPWCQWCQVLEHEVLPDPEIKRLMNDAFEVRHVNVDVEPAWMDLPGVEGLPTLAFFDERGRHVLTRSGYRPVPDMADLLLAVKKKLAAGEMTPYPARPSGPRLAEKPSTREQAKQALARFEKKIFFAVNSNDGGFRTPSRHPYPDLLRELSEWTKLGAPKRVSSWIELSMEHALRGRSPRIDGKPLPDMDFGGTELRRLSRLGPEAGPRWREGVDRLHDADPFQGLQDPVSHGLFRYCAGPGWYNPHFERRALDNLSWVLLLRQRGQKREAALIEAFVNKTFGSGPLLNAVQKADPFYYRLRAPERAGVPAPKVEELARLEVQARAARVDPGRCDLLLRVPTDAWPKGVWQRAGEGEGEAPASPDATPDAVGELLLALASCPGEEHAKAAGELGDLVAQRWQKGLPTRTKPTRLHRLAAGLCAARPKLCGRALATIAELDLDLDFAPPLVALAQHAE